MAKAVVHIGLAVSTDGFLPGKSNIVNLAACLGQKSSFAVNIAPVGGTYNTSPFWAKHPEEFEKFKFNPVSIDAAMAQFRLWLRQFQGNLIACTSSLDFWHLYLAMLSTGKDCPFGSMPLDTNSYYAGREARKTPLRLQNAVAPLEVALERWKIVTEDKYPHWVPKEKTKISKTFTFSPRRREEPQAPTSIPRAYIEGLQDIRSALSDRATITNMTPPPASRRYVDNATWAATVALSPNELVSPEEEQ